MPDTDYGWTTAADRHVHHWLIAEANGPVSRGTCRECRKEREFRNWLPVLDFISREERAFG